jgi:hypothetical protein
VSDRLEVQVRVDSKISKPIFNKDAWGKAKNLLKEILLGFYSDPPGINFYRFEIDKNGEVKKDRYGMELLKCGRGTNLTEAAHRLYNITFKHLVGIELGDTLFRERRHRQNVDILHHTITKTTLELVITILGTLTCCKHW